MAMTLSTRGRYAARIMVCLADKQDDGTLLTRRDIAAHEDISADYVEQLMAPLRAAGLVLSHRGRNGGFSLGRTPNRITVADILQAVEGPLIPVPCVGTETCDRAANCPTRPVWKRATEALHRVFSETTVADMLKDSKAAVTPSYSI
ncbi:MAG: Rrf2 family transcriptional regulator [Lentisphaerae bacterium]|jgi:Rrf2 family transcriptional regulator, cysteine metabolism repressor|nr:Rrf2 family transcriptional regulator [Lentisphaerota bacterium]MBT4816278.1 Rrf2 family transcriptional regulator [Lentisphaerota bacterium]MBT5608823.1 Rrf2 family transcriptional regulator [Lentisphaerota bacterium]MBT7059983.1 Rrf2 family transcriptional regulator [Lentisphaerota bacterium]MBT7840309.1 Rrf2 family transcriptional regulator [Lentisphaerota bacterium]